jgi:hypothetical protein
MLDKVDQILSLARQGFSARYIQGELDLDEGPMRIARFIREFIPPEPTAPRVRKPKSEPISRGDYIPRNVGEPGRQPYDHFGKSMLEILRNLFVMEGRDLHVCELCGERQETYCIIHHTKYLGATFRDLMLVCQRCNLQPDNKHLK